MPAPQATGEVALVGDCSFKAIYRLRKTDEYSSVFAFRKSVRGKFFVLHFRPSEGAGARLGLVVAKKLARRAKLRNLVKRLTREHFRLARAQLPAYDLILRLNAPVAAATRAQMNEDLSSLFRRLPK